METELQKRAVERLTEIFLDYTFEYPICVTPDMHIDVSSGIPISCCIQSGWLANADKAYDTVRLMSGLKNGELSVFALVEDGMFEKNIMYPVALLSEMLWSCDAELNDIIRYTALREYVTFA